MNAKPTQVERQAFMEAQESFLAQNQGLKRKNQICCNTILHTIINHLTLGGEWDRSEHVLCGGAQPPIGMLFVSAPFLELTSRFYA